MFGESKHDPFAASRDRDRLSRFEEHRRLLLIPAVAGQPQTSDVKRFGPCQRRKVIRLVEQSAGFVEMALQAAQVREMVQLGVPVAGHVAYIDRYGHAALGLQLSGETLQRVPGYSSSAGRALAAFDDRILADTLAVPRRKHTPFTITDPERLHRILRAAREAGWVSTREEFTRGFSSCAAPVLLDGGPVAAISVAGPTTHILGLRRDFIVASVCRAAQRVSTLIRDWLCNAAPNASCPLTSAAWPARMTCSR